MQYIKYEEKILGFISSNPEKGLTLSLLGSFVQNKQTPPRKWTICICSGTNTSSSIWNALIKSFQLSGHTFGFRLQENELSIVIKQTLPSDVVESFLLNGHTLIWVSFARKWTLFSNNTNSTIRMNSSRAFICLVKPLGFVYKKMNSL